MNYQVADFIIRIKNAYLARRPAVVAIHSKNNKAIAELLVKKGFLKDSKETQEDGKKVLTVALRYDKRRPALTHVKIISKPSLRKYIGAKEIGLDKNRHIGLSVISTSHGIMSEKEAEKKGVGGELLFKIW